MREESLEYREWGLVAMAAMSAGERGWNLRVEALEEAGRGKGWWES